MVDETFNGQTALHVACQNGHMDIVNNLIDKGANLEEEVHPIPPITFPF